MSARLPASRPRVLLVGSDAAQLDALGALLKSEGAEVIVYQSSIGIAREVQLREPQVVLLDMEMPMSRGEDLLDILVNKVVPPRPYIILWAAQVPQMQALVARYPDRVIGVLSKNSGGAAAPQLRRLLTRIHARMGRPS